MAITKRKKPQQKNVTKQPKESVVHMELDDIKALEEPIYVPPVSQPPKAIRGRPKQNKYLPYQEAAEFVRAELIPSRSKYHEWWDRHKPKAIPKFPYRTYEKEWTSWNDWLGNDNEFNTMSSRVWRPFEDAVQWVHKQQLDSYQKWIEFCKENRKTMPSDIPSRPDLVYSGWRTWNYWLGNRPIEAVEAAKQALKSQIFFIIHDPLVPENVFTFGVEPGGQYPLKERWEREKFDIVRLFWFSQEHSEQIKKIIDSMSVPYLDNDKQRICPNVWEILWYLSMLMERIIRF